MQSTEGQPRSAPLSPYISLNSVRSAEVVVPIVLEYVRARSVVDFGCKHGEWLSVFRAHSVNRIMGFDRPKRLERGLMIDPAEFAVADLAQPVTIDARFDLAVCIEVAEHLPQTSAASLVRSLTAAAPAVLFSAAIPGQGGHGHLNEQPRQYWIDLFQHDGFASFDCLRPRIWKNGQVAWWYRQSLFMFCNPAAVLASPLLDRESIGSEAKD